jgi:DNA (cytosine-5)-methyltransferase 1
MNTLSLFSNIGVAEAYLSSIGVEVVLANELISRRAELYSKIYPNSEMVCGDIANRDIKATIIKRAKSLSVNAIIAAPPCQGMSRAYRTKKSDDKRNLLILHVIEMAKEIRPMYIFIENVPSFSETIIQINDEMTTIGEQIKKELTQLYHISTSLIDTMNYAVPQTRKREIILLTRRDISEHWQLPKEDDFRVSLEDAIGDLPSLDPHIIDISAEEMKTLFPEYSSKLNEAKKISRWHKPPTHIKRQVVTMMHTPTGKTAFDNPKHIPLKSDGTPVVGYKSTYRRLRWCDPASTVTMDNRKISSQNNVHPGRFIGQNKCGDNLYSDARALSLLEIMRIMSLPDDWPLPHNANEAFVRSVVGEGIPPLFVKKVFNEIMKKSD